jgi:hypothetical protein
MACDVLGLHILVLMSIPEGYTYRDLSLQVGGGLDTSTIVLQVIRDDVKGIQCQGV